MGQEVEQGGKAKVDKARQVRLVVDFQPVVNAYRTLGTVRMQSVKDTFPSLQKAACIRP